MQEAAAARKQMLDAARADAREQALRRMRERRSPRVEPATTKPLARSHAIELLDAKAKSLDCRGDDTTDVVLDPPYCRGLDYPAHELGVTFEVSPRSQIVVEEVKRGSSAARLGILPGAVLTKIDGIPLTGAEYRQQLALIAIEERTAPMTLSFCAEAPRDAARPKQLLPTLFGRNKAKVVREAATPVVLSPPDTDRSADLAETPKLDSAVVQVL